MDTYIYTYVCTYISVYSYIYICYRGRAMCLWIVNFIHYCFSDNRVALALAHSCSFSNDCKCRLCGCTFALVHAQV